MIPRLELLLNHTLFVCLFSFRRGLQEHIEVASKLLDHTLARFPDGGLFLFIKGRLERLRRDLRASVACFMRSADMQTEFVQLQHLCYYELGWSHFFLGEYGESLKYFGVLSVESEWSKAFYGYMKALCLLELGDVAQAQQLLLSLPDLVKRSFGGKTLSVEQFVVRKVTQYVPQAGKDDRVSSSDGGGGGEGGSGGGGGGGSAAESFSVGGGDEGSVEVTGDSRSGVGSDGLVDRQGRRGEDQRASDDEGKDDADDEFVDALSLNEDVAGSCPVGLVLPSLEVMYLWNGFTQFDRDLLMRASGLVRSYMRDRGLDGDDAGSVSPPAGTPHAVANVGQDMDERCVCKLLMGSLLKECGELAAAMACFQYIEAHSKHIRRELYVIPHARYERASLLLLVYHMRRDGTPAAAASAAMRPSATGIEVPATPGDELKAIKTLLGKASHFDKDYNFEVRLRVRIHLAMDKVNVLQAQAK